MVAVSHRKPVNTTRISSARPLSAISAISPASSAIVPSTVVTLRKITPSRGWGLVCRSPAALTAQMQPRTRSTAPAAHALESSGRSVPALYAMKAMIIVTTAADDTRSLQVRPIASTSPSMGASAAVTKSALQMPATHRRR